MSSIVEISIESTPFVDLSRPEASSCAPAEPYVLSPTGHLLSFLRLSKCSFRGICTRRDVEQEIDSKLDQCDEFCEEYKRRVLLAGIPSQVALDTITRERDRVISVLNSQKDQAIEVIHNFAELRGLFPSVSDAEFFKVNVVTQYKMLKSLPQVKLFANCDSDCWESLVCFFDSVPPNVQLMKASLEWLQTYVESPLLPLIIRAVGWATSAPWLASPSTSLSVQLYSSQGHRDTAAQIEGLITDFRRAMRPILLESLKRLSRLLPKDVIRALCADRSPFYIEGTARTIQEIFSRMPSESSHTLLSLDGEVGRMIFAIKNRIVWTAPEGDALAELLIVFSHIRCQGLVSRDAALSILDAVQELREEILLRSDPFLLEHPFSDPGLALTGLCAKQLQELAVLPHERLKRALREII